MHKKTIIFDLVGVCFTFNKLRLYRHVGFTQCVRYLLSTGKSPLQLFFDVIEEMRREDPPGYVAHMTYKGQPLPASFEEWQKGLRSTQSIFASMEKQLNHLEKNGHFKKKYHAQLARAITRVIFNPLDCPSALRSIHPVHRAIKKLHQEGHRLMVLSNLDRSTFEHLHEQFADFFDQFDDVIISSDVGMIKPHADIFEYVLSKHGLAPNDTLFIDDQEENIATAKQLGIAGVLLKKPQKIKRLLQR